MKDVSLGYDPIKRRLSEAEGYLMLGMPQKALAILEARDDWATMRFEAAFLTGETLRILGRYREALKLLEMAAGLRPENVDVAVSLGWCYKRTQRLAQAIDALGRAVRHNRKVAILHYNLACYWALAGTPTKAIAALGLALELNANLRGQIPHESDLDSLRGDPGFEQLLAAGWSSSP